MNFYKKFPAFIVSLIVICIALYFFLNNLIYKSLPSDYEEKKSAIIKDTIRVYKNHYGIPHIIAKNEKDAFFMIGYTHAQDRLWQMDVMRNTGRGKLSELFGEQTFISDKFFRCLGLSQIADNIYSGLSKTSKSVLESYCNGVNTYIDKHPNNLSFEFGSMDFKPEKWIPTDCIIIERLLAIEMSSSFWTDLNLGEIAEKIGPQRALNLLPQKIDNSICVYDTVNPVLQKTKAKPQLKPITEIFKNNNTINSLANELNQIQKIICISSNSAGSNAWVTKKSKTGNYGAILANDPHFNLGIPAKWYQMHVSCPTFNTIGFTIPGIPFFWVGRNDKIAWGFTNMMLDDCDYFIEKTDSKDQNYYFASDGKRNKFTFIKDTIKIKNSSDYVYYIRKTVKSNVLSDFQKYDSEYDALNLKDTVNSIKLLNKYCITFNWTGKEKSDEFLSLYNINKSRNWSQFFGAMSTFNTPGLIFVYSDKSGNMGLTPVGLIPQRQKECIPQLPNPRWLENYDWQNYTRASSLFQPIVNPSKKYLISANNRISRNQEQYISSYFEPSSRASRIEEFLKDYDDYTSREAQIMQMDILSNYAQQFLNYTLPHLEKNINSLDDIEKSALNKIKYWDFYIGSNYSAPSILNTFLTNLIRNTFYDELGDKLYNSYVSNSSLPTKRIIELLSDSTSSVWFDDVSTKSYEYRNWIVVKSFKDAVNYLKDKFDDDDPNKWTWGKLHTLTLKHTLTNNKLMKPVVTLGNFEMSGNNTTINYSSWDFSNPYEVRAGASMRFIADMSEDNIYCSLPGGSSGDPLSKNYANQVQLWLNGGYLSLNANYEPAADFQLSILLIPEH